MAVVNISKAAELAGVSRATVHRHLKKGKLSKVRQPDGSPGIDTSELLRHFGELKGEQDVIVQSVAPDISENTQLLQQRITLVERENQLLRHELDSAHEREHELLGLLKTKLLTGPGGRKKKGSKKGK